MFTRIVEKYVIEKWGNKITAEDGPVFYKSVPSHKEFYDKDDRQVFFKDSAKAAPMINWN